MPAHRSVWSLLTRRRGRDPTATEIYGRLVAQARAEPFYASLGVPDTPEGRLEMIMLHLVLMQERLKVEGETGAELSRALSETFVSDLDDCLRELGVGDLTVPKKIKMAAAALFDRSRDYGSALAAGDVATMAGHLRRHVLMAVEESGAGSAEALAGDQIAVYAGEYRTRLAAADIDAVVAGSVAAPAPVLAARS